MGKMVTFWSSELGFIDLVGLLMDQNLVFLTHETGTVNALRSSFFPCWR